MRRSTEPFLRLKHKCNLYQGDANEILARLLPHHGRVIIITDEPVERRHAKLMGSYPRLRIGQGEQAKSLSTANTLYKRFIELGVDRSWMVVAIGGGVVCDLAGFVASTYMRGLKFGFVPTTLLAQVDASVGGKNGVNIGGYKNMVGCFQQPQFVICDSALLATLPIREFRAGMAEVIKAAVIGNRDLFWQIATENNLNPHRGIKILDPIVRAAIEVKAAIVRRDEKEQGERRLLNLGHTFGHAIEKCNPKYNHGEAVAVGMVIACQTARKMGLLSSDDAELIIRAVAEQGLPIEYTGSRTKFLNALYKDKKRAGDRIFIVLPKGIGECIIHPIGFYELKELLCDVNL